MFRKYLASALILGMGITSAASAEFTVPANKSSVVYDFAVWFPQDCSYPGKPTYKVRTAPKHGRLDFAFGNTKAPNLPARCKGKVKGLQVIYTPNRGYRGPDSFVLSVRQIRYLNDSGAPSRTVRPKFAVK